MRKDEHGHDEVKLMFADVKKAHLNAKKNGSSCRMNSKSLGGTPS